MLINVRYFKFDDEEGDIRECTESEFLECPYPIEYNRSTVFENGVSQIELTKIPTF